MCSLPRPQICTGLPPIPCTSLVESTNNENSFGSSTMTLFMPVSIIYNLLSESVSEQNGSLLICLITGAEDCAISGGVSLIV